MKKFVINIPVRPIGMNFEVRGTKVSTDFDVLKLAGAICRTQNAESERKSPKQAKPITIIDS